jgi:exopolysaccharide biosynthesis polyprenyl glycosylphosphotransferase
MRRHFYFALAVSDSVAILVGFLVAGVLRLGEIGHPQVWTILAVLLPFYAGLAFNSKAYSASVLRDWRQGVPSILGSLYVAAAAILFVSFYLKTSEDMSRVMLGVGLGASSMLLLLGRLIVGGFAKRAFAGAPMSTLLITDDVRCECPAGVDQVEASRHGLSPNSANPHVFDRLGRLLQNVDSVVVASPPESRAAWARALKGVNIHGEIVVPELDALGGIGTTRFNGMPTMLVSAGPLRGRDECVKRALDLSLVLVALLFLLPLLLLVAVAVRLDSDGPVFFRQQRLGYGNRLFLMYKFRSMRLEACDSSGARSTGRDDDRITRVGRLIRATSVDELPQLLNILKGEMSFVGPRPHALGSLAGNQLFWEVDATYWHRHACKPGLTGLAQIRGFRGATHRREDLVNRLQADLEYVNGWSVWRDISILLATFKVVVHRNAF